MELLHPQSKEAASTEMGAVLMSSNGKLTDGEERATDARLGICG
jgi:hypothetical protein